MGAFQKTGLQSVCHQTIDTLSKGFKRRVGLAQAILHDPDVLILDEPTDGLDPNQKHHVRELIKEMAPEKSIIISTHILEEVEAVCARAVVIDKGKVVVDGTADELQSRVPYHNAVMLRTTPDCAELVKQRVEALQEVAKVETVGKPNGSIRLRAFPSKGVAIAPRIANLLRDNSLPIDEIYIEQGKLDDVFRQLTTSDNGAHNA